MATTTSQPTGWMAWIVSLFYGHGQHQSSLEDDQTSPQIRSLEESVIEDNWVLIESQLDKLFQETTNKRADEIKQELEALRNQRSSMPAPKLQNTFFKIKQLFDEIDEETAEQLAYPLTGNDRASICSTIVSEDGCSWLNALKSVLVDKVTNLPELWEKFENEFYETKFAKNIAGTMKDLSFFVYNAATMGGLTCRILNEILISWSQKLLACVSDYFDVEPNEEIISTIEQELLRSCSKLIKLHASVAKNSKKAKDREGKLPMKWEQEMRERQAAIAAIKARGADAKWEDFVDRKELCDLPESGNTSKIAAAMEKILIFRVPTK